MSARTPSQHDIQAVLDESGPDYEHFEFEPASSGTRADVYLVELTYKGEVYDVVVKFQPPGEERFAVEPRLHEYVGKRTDIPVPQILVYENEPTADIPAYFVTERVRGDSLSDYFDSISESFWGEVVEQVGRIAGDLHADIAFEAFGRLMLHHDRLTIGDWRGNWREYFADLTRSHIDGLDGTPFEGNQSTATRALEDALAVVPTDAIPRLVHDDLTPANLLHDGDADEPITAVLDWQDTLAAHPEYQLAQLEFLYLDSMFDDPAVRSRLRDRLFEGYRTQRTFEVTDQYEECKPIYQLSTLLWRMTGFEAAHDEDGLGRARAKFQYRQQFDRLLDQLPR